MDKEYFSTQPLILHIFLTGSTHLCASQVPVILLLQEWNDFELRWVSHVQFGSNYKFSNLSYLILRTILGLKVTDLHLFSNSPSLVYFDPLRQNDDAIAVHIHFVETLTAIALGYIVTQINHDKGELIQVYGSISIPVNNIKGLSKRLYIGIGLPRLIIRF